MAYYELNLSTTVSLSNPETMCRGVFTLTTTHISHFFTHIPSTCKCVGGPGPDFGPLVSAKLVCLLSAADGLRRNTNTNTNNDTTYPHSSTNSHSIIDGSGKKKILDASDKTGVAFVFLANVLGVADRLFHSEQQQQQQQESFLLRLPTDDEVKGMCINVPETWDELTRKLVLRPVPEGALSEEGLDLF